MKPSSVHDLNISNVTMNSMLLSWKVGKIIEGQNITFKIKYLSEFGQAQVSI